MKINTIICSRSGLPHEISEKKDDVHPEPSGFCLSGISDLVRRRTGYSRITENQRWHHAISDFLSRDGSALCCVFDVLILLGEAKYAFDGSAKLGYNCKYDAMNGFRVVI